MYTLYVGKMEQTQCFNFPLAKCVGGGTGNFWYLQTVLFRIFMEISLTGRFFGDKPFWIKCSICMPIYIHRERGILFLIQRSKGSLESVSLTSGIKSYPISFKMSNVWERWMPEKSSALMQLDDRTASIWSKLNYTWSRKHALCVSTALCLFIHRLGWLAHRWVCTRMGSV